MVVARSNKIRCFMLLESDIMSSGKLPVISYDVSFRIKIQCVPHCLDPFPYKSKNHTGRLTSIAIK